MNNDGAAHVIHWREVFKIVGFRRNLSDPWMWSVVPRKCIAYGLGFLDAENN